MRGFIPRLVGFIMVFLLLLSSPAIAAPSGSGNGRNEPSTCQQRHYSQIDLFDLRFSLPAPYREISTQGANSSEIHFLTTEDPGGRYLIVGMAAQNAEELGISDESPESVFETIAIAFSSQNINDPEEATAEFEAPAYHSETGLYSARMFVVTNYGVEMTAYFVLNPDSGAVGVLSSFTKTNPGQCVLHQLDGVALQRLS